MRNPRLLISAAFLIHALGWVLPVVKDGVTLPQGLPGWEARELCRASAWIATLAFVVNAHWVVQFGSDRMDLRVGYYLWWLSFILLALGLFRLSQRNNRRPH